jgi:hypothetical protein
MRKFLSRRGYMLAPAAVAGILEQTQAAMPAGLAAQIVACCTGKAVVSSAILTTIQGVEAMMFWAKVKIAATVAACCLLVGTGMTILAHKVIAVPPSGSRPAAGEMSAAIPGAVFAAAPVSAPVSAAENATDWAILVDNWLSPMPLRLYLKEDGGKITAGFALGDGVYAPNAVAIEELKVSANGLTGKTLITPMKGAPSKEWFPEKGPVRTLALDLVREKGKVSGTAEITDDKGGKVGKPRAVKGYTAPAEAPRIWWMELLGHGVAQTMNWGSDWICMKVSVADGAARRAEMVLGSAGPPCYVRGWAVEQGRFEIKGGNLVASFGVRIRPKMIEGLAEDPRNKGWLDKAKAFGGGAVTFTAPLIAGYSSGQLAYKGADGESVGCFIARVTTVPMVFEEDEPRGRR